MHLGRMSQMREPAHEPKILQGKRRVRYLKLIALFKILKGGLLFVLGFSILFLNSRPAWLDQISDWSEDQLLLHHSKAVFFLLNKIQELSAGGGALRATAILALFYCGVLMTEGIGVYMQKRWAEWLMICATAALIPLEIRHVWHRVAFHGAVVGPLVILFINCFIVWFLYRVLKWSEPPVQTAQKTELMETR